MGLLLHLPSTLHLHFSMNSLLDLFHQVCTDFDDSTAFRSVISLLFQSI